MSSPKKSDVTPSTSTTTTTVRKRSSTASTATPKEKLRSRFNIDEKLLSQATAIAQRDATRLQMESALESKEKVDGDEDEDEEEKDELDVSDSVFVLLFCCFFTDYIHIIHYLMISFY